MAQIEMNMLSVITCGSTSVRVFCPGMDKLALDDKEHKVKYPVLWLLHDDGGAALDWLATPAERVAEKLGIFIICPDQHHTLCTDMKYGPRFEHFMNTELPGICRNSLPISADPARNFVGGVGTGAYGAVKMVLKHPETFSKAVAFNGIVDMEALIAKTLAGEETGVNLGEEQFKAIFGDLNAFHGGKDDLFAQEKNGSFLLTYEQGSGVEAENKKLAEYLGAEIMELDEDADCGSCQRSLPAAAKWLLA